MRTSVLICLFAGYAALLSARVSGAPPQSSTQPPLPENHPKIQKPATEAMTDATKGEKPPPDFARDVLPIIEGNCLRCHNAATQKGGLILDTHEDIMTGGENGTVLVAGDASKSRLVQMIRDQIEPKMPPKSTLRPDEIAVFAAWIDAGAKDSTESPLDRLTAKIPSIAPDAALKPSVNAVAYRPDGAELAVPGYREVRRVPAGTEVTAAAGTSCGGCGIIAVAHAGRRDRSGAQRRLQPRRQVDRGRRRHSRRDRRSPDLERGDRRAGAYVEGPSRLRVSGRLQQARHARRDVQLRPHGARVGRRDGPSDARVPRAYGSGLRGGVQSERSLARVGRGRSLRQAVGSRVGVAHVHADRADRRGAVARVPSFGPRAERGRRGQDDPHVGADADAEPRDGWRRGGEDRGRKPPRSPRRSQRAGPRRRQRAANAQAAKTGAADDGESEVRVPPVRIGSDARSIRGHNAPILRIAYSPDGKWLASSDNDGVVKIWDAATGKEMRALEKQPDWAQGLDWSPDGTRLAIGRYDGTVGIYDASTGRRVSSPVLTVSPAATAKTPAKTAPKTTAATSKATGKARP